MSQCTHARRGDRACSIVKRCDQTSSQLTRLDGLALNELQKMRLKFRHTNLRFTFVRKVKNCIRDVFACASYSRLAASRQHERAKSAGRCTARHTAHFRSALHGWLHSSNCPAAQQAAQLGNDSWMHRHLIARLPAQVAARLAAKSNWLRSHLHMFRHSWLHNSLHRSLHNHSFDLYRRIDESLSRGHLTCFRDIFRCFADTSPSHLLTCTGQDRCSV
jgi:hypothetical protein